MSSSSPLTFVELSSRGAIVAGDSAAVIDSDTLLRASQDIIRNIATNIKPGVEEYMKYVNTMIATEPITLVIAVEGNELNTPNGTINVQKWNISQHQIDRDRNIDMLYAFSPLFNLVRCVLPRVCVCVVLSIMCVCSSFVREYGDGSKVSIGGSGNMRTTKIERDWKKSHGKGGKKKRQRESE